MSSAVEAVQGLKVVDAYDLDDELRGILKPGEMVRDGDGRRHRLPRYFYEIPSHDVGMSTRLTPHFGLNEFIFADLKEASRLHGIRATSPARSASWPSTSSSSARSAAPRSTSP